MVASSDQPFAKVELIVKYGFKKKKEKNTEKLKINKVRKYLFKKTVRKNFL